MTRLPRRPAPRRLLPALLLACATTLPAAAGTAPAPESILRAGARPAPSHTPFVEVRQSAMLKKPLRIEGEYRREADGRLVREVRVPYAETTTLSAGEAVIERAGRAPRRVSLQQVPELEAIQNGFGALLAGDVERLERTYQVQSEGTLQAWTMRMQPRDPKLARTLARIDLHGQGSELLCVESHPARGEPQRTLMAAAATAAAGVEDAQALAALCHGTAR
ncbi:LolA-related protein [Pseudoxanthomonas suwonensis]|uniref:LolA-related protein n=1 Tax=Pseudoxanthomonas suwonensis TaxID=314722 RepID=UPI00138F90E1|nr:fatty acyl CoA synthetase [Pseudoxanthomonas suwonensis]